MINTLSTTATNPYMESLQQVLEDSPASLEWLVIAHQDPRMVQALSAALSSESAAILETSQENWDEEGQALEEAIGWALREREIKHLVFVGHSHGGGPISRASLTATAASGIAEGQARIGNRYLLAGLERSNAQARGAQARFVAQLERLSQTPVIHTRCSNGTLALYGLYYRAESGLFLLYDVQQKTFRPLLP